MNLKKSNLLIKSLLESSLRGSAIHKDFEDSEVSLADGTELLISGSAVADATDDSDFNRETGYGKLISLSNFEFNIINITKLGSGGATDVTNEEWAVRAAEEYMAEQLEDRKYES